MCIHLVIPCGLEMHECMTLIKIKLKSLLLFLVYTHAHIVRYTHTGSCIRGKELSLLIRLCNPDYEVEGRFNVRCDEGLIQICSLCDAALLISLWFLSI